MPVYTITGTKAAETISTSGTSPSVTSTNLVDNNATDEKDIIRAGGGKDNVAPGGGDDLVNLGAGSDAYTWLGGAGSDTVNGGSGSDRAAFKGFAGGVSLSAASGHARLNDTVDTVDMVNIERVFLKGSNGFDSFSVGDLSTTHVRSVVIDLSHSSFPELTDLTFDYVQATGTRGNDRIGLVATADSLKVTGLGIGFTIQMFGPAEDSLFVDGGRGADRMDASSLPATYLGIEFNGGNGRDTLIGGAGVNQLYGGRGSDFLSSGGGADHLYGAGPMIRDNSADKLRGGGGADWFYLEVPKSSAAADRILDFKPGLDKIALYDSAFFLALDDTIDADEFVIGKKALDGNDHLIYDDMTGNLFFDANGSDPGGAIRIAVLQKGLMMSAADFMYPLV